MVEVLARINSQPEEGKATAHANRNTEQCYTNKHVQIIHSVVFKVIFVIHYGRILCFCLFNARPSKKQKCNSNLDNN